MPTTTYERTLVLVDEVPDIETVFGGSVAEHLAPLKDTPYHWARVYGPCPGTSMAAQMWAHGIKKGNRKGIEPGEFEAKVRTINGERFVFARYVGATPNGG